MIDAPDAARLARRRRPGCLTVIAVGVAFAVGTFLAMNAYAHLGDGSAGRLFMRQRDAMLAAVQQVPVPPDARPAPYGMGGDSIEPVGSPGEAQAAYVASRHPLQDVIEIFCLDACGPHWRPHNGIDFRRELQSPTSPYAVCRFLDGALPTSHLTKIRAVPPTRNYRSTCRFVAKFGVARLEVGVFPASDPGAATIDIEGATERKAVYVGAQ